MGYTKRTMLLLSLLTLFGMSGIGYLIINWFDGVPILPQLKGTVGYGWQLLYGAGYGLAVALLALALIQLPFFEKSRRFFAQMITKLKPGIPEILLYSFCAAVGEEILFRAAIQQFWGIWLTSLLFIALHGYLNPLQWRMMIFGVFMVLMSAGIGYLMYFGLAASMMAHFVYDVLMFSFLSRLAVTDRTSS